MAAASTGSILIRIVSPGLVPKARLMPEALFEFSKEVNGYAQCIAGFVATICQQCKNTPSGATSKVASTPASMSLALRQGRGVSGR